MEAKKEPYETVTVFVDIDDISKLNISIFPQNMPSLLRHYLPIRAVEVKIGYS